MSPSSPCLRSSPAKVAAKTIGTDTGKFEERFSTEIIHNANLYLYMGGWVVVGGAIQANTIISRHKTLAYFGGGSPVNYKTENLCSLLFYNRKIRLL